MGDYVDFKAIKAEVSVEEVAHRYGVNLKRSNGSHERGKCPLPTHPLGDDTNSFSINTAKQVWICHSTACAKGRRGKKGGDVIEMVAVIEGCSLRDAGLKLAAWYHVPKRTEIETDKPDSSSDTKAAREPVVDEHYGIYDPLAEWIELRAANETLSTLEKSAYLAVLGQIEELVKAGQGSVQ